MASNRRMGPQSAATGAALMDATEAVMREEGYAAVTSRRVAERAGVNQQTVYYYFQTLHALWHTSSDPFDAALTMEYLALANHNEMIRLETIEFGERIRRMEVDKLAERISRTSPDPQAASPFAVIMAITYVAHLLGFEATLGLRGGHKETRVLVEWCLRQLEPSGARAKAMPELS